MPIKGLTHRAPAFPRLGELRKGAEKKGNKPGADLNQLFRFTSKDETICKAFYDAYPQPERINCYLPFRTTDENMSAWVEEWGAGSLKWRGDGERLVLRQNGRGYEWWNEGDPNAPEQPQGGKESGRLKIIVPELKRLGYVTVLTTSINDIMELHSNLQAFEAVSGERGLQGAPFVLSRIPREISTPSGKNGQRARRTKWLLHLEPDPQWVALQITGMRNSALSAPGYAALPSGAIVDNDTGEIVDSYADDEPETVTAEIVEEKPLPTVTKPKKGAPPATIQALCQWVMKNSKLEYWRHDTHVFNAWNQYFPNEEYQPNKAREYITALRVHAADRMKEKEEQAETPPDEAGEPKDGLSAANFADFCNVMQVEIGIDPADCVAVMKDKFGTSIQSSYDPVKFGEYMAHMQSLA